MTPLLAWLENRMHPVAARILLMLVYAFCLLSIAVSLGKGSGYFDIIYRDVG